MVAPYASLSKRTTAMSTICSNSPSGADVMPRVYSTMWSKWQECWVLGAGCSVPVLSACSVGSQSDDWFDAGCAAGRQVTRGHRNRGKQRDRREQGRGVVGTDAEQQRRRGTAAQHC